MSTKFVGESIPRLDAVAKVTGQALYPGDYSMEGMLHAKVLWSEYPHALIHRIDISAVCQCQGVVTVLTHDDVPVNEFGIYVKDQHVLAEGIVRSMGDPVALVIAETEESAARARDLIKVDYEPQPGLFDPREAMRPDAPLVHESKGSNILNHIKIRKGDIEEGFAQADVIVEGTYHTPHVEHAYLQPEAGLGYIDQEGRVTVVVAAQWAHDDVHQIAHALGLVEEQVREIVPAVGGAFGGREDISLQILVALGAFKTGQPVQLVYSREESMRGHGKRHAFYMTHRWGATKEGKLTAVEIEMIADAGAYLSTSLPVLRTAASFAAGPYVVPHARVDAYVVHTNNLFTMAMR
ncbi:MAG: xanthine dehydrogenase family protein molybdopterin-binding subunit, partial [Anaerolineae bacterium]